MNKHIVVASTLQILNDHELEAVSGGGSDDDSEDYYNIGDTERNGHGYDMVCPDDGAPGGMSWRDIGST